MLVEIKVPQLAESVSEATLVSWKKRAGDYVRNGEHLIDIETDKVVLEINAPQDGQLKEIRKQDGADVTSSEVIAVIDTDAKAQAAASPTAAVKPAAGKTAAAAAPTRNEPAPAPAAKTPAAPIAATPKTSPAARHLLKERGLDASAVVQDGATRVRKEDVLAATAKAEVPAAPESAPAASAESPMRDMDLPPVGREEKRVPMTRLRRRVAERLMAAQKGAAILTTFNEINLARLVELRARYKASFKSHYGVGLGYTAFFVQAVVEALKRFPIINASVNGDDIVYHNYFDIGVAVAAPRGLVVPVLRDADRMSVPDIELGIAEFARKAEDDTLTVSDLSGGTFTLTNGGVFGSMLSTPILNPPQSAILGMHKIEDRPIAEDGEVRIRPMMYVALSYDHRIIDGKEAVQFLVAVKDQLEDPARLLLKL